MFNSCIEGLLERSNKAVVVREVDNSKQDGFEHTFVWSQKQIREQPCNHAAVISKSPATPGTQHDCIVVMKGSDVEYPGDTAVHYRGDFHHQVGGTLIQPVGIWSRSGNKRQLIRHF